MFHKLKVCTLAFVAFGFTPDGAVADEALMNGVRPFICDGDAIVLFEDDDGWKTPTYSAAKVKRTDNGWRLEDTNDGSVMYLREESDYSWVVDRVSEEGHTKLDCVDLADSVSQAVTIIKPRLDQAILGTERALREAKLQLANELVKNSDLRAKNKSLLKALSDAEVALEAEQSKYDALRVAAVKGSSAAPFLRDLLEMGPSERNAEINNSNLSQALNGGGKLPMCVKILRDKAKLSDQCEEVILDFLLIEGWQ